VSLGVYDVFGIVESLEEYEEATKNDPEKLKNKNNNYKKMATIIYIKNNIIFRNKMQKIHNKILTSVKKMSLTS
jgi:hypothetical protein